VVKLRHEGEQDPKA